MRGILFLFWFLAYFLSKVFTLENPTPRTDWYNSSPDDSHQKESLANGWFKYPSGHWGRKFHYGCSSAPPSSEPTLVRPYASFYLLRYLVGYYLLGRFSSMFGRFAYLGQLGHLAMVTVPIGLVIAGLNIGKVVTQRRGKAFAKASWNVYWAAVNGELKTTLALEAYHEHLKANFGLHSKFNKFFSLLQHEQEKTISKIRDLANCIPPPSLPPNQPSSSRPSRVWISINTRPLILSISLSLLLLPSWKGLK
ncbi:hypothetical protein DSO57_1009083 [Entomophthora muscae]|uniref:Uncharacterized protein n=1 Tax=Entomophthora muscae TaxID=34485 RepID=A0ACC2S8S4_9FUNG|nr:hypothetical protein DSO57_1009083 [Entomophthora muscae]